MIEPTVDEKFNLRLYEVRQSVKSLFKFQEGYRVVDEHENTIFYAKRDRLFIYRNIHVFDGENDNAPQVLFIKDNSWSDSWGYFTVIDTRTNEVVGHLKRRFLKSWIRETWDFYGPNNEYLGSATAKSLVKTIIRKFGLLAAIPIIGPILAIFMRLHFELLDPEGRKFGEFTRKVSLRDFYTMQLDDMVIDGRLLVAAAILFDSGEKR